MELGNFFPRQIPIQDQQFVYPTGVPLAEPDGELLHVPAELVAVSLHPTTADPVDVHGGGPVLSPAVGIAPGGHDVVPRAACPAQFPHDDELPPDETI